MFSVELQNKELKINLSHNIYPPQKKYNKICNLVILHWQIFIEWEPVNKYWESFKFCFPLCGMCACIFTIKYAVIKILHLYFKDLQKFYKMNSNIKYIHTLKSSSIFLYSSIISSSFSLWFFHSTGSWYKTRSHDTVSLGKTLQRRSKGWTTKVKQNLTVTIFFSRYWLSSCISLWFIPDKEEMEFWDEELVLPTNCK